jgi:hypothetical protein
MAANVEAMVREGIAAVKDGRKDEGRALLLKAVELDPYNEDGWLWLSGLVEGEEDQRTCLENVLAINPNNQRARKGIEFLTTGSLGASIPETPTPLASSTPPPPPPDPDFFSQPAVSAFDTMTSVEWGAPDPNETYVETSSPSAAPKAPEPTKEVYDEWVSSLGLAGGKASSPFTDTAFSSESTIFDGGPFDSTTFDVPEPSAPPAAPGYGFGGTSIPYTPPPEPAAPAARGGSMLSPAEPASGSLHDALDADDDGEIEEPEELLVFAVIPRDVEPTRLPGTRGGSSPLVAVLAFILFILNVGMATLLVSRLLG